MALEAQWVEPVFAHLSLCFEETSYRNFYGCLLPNFN